MEITDNTWKFPANVDFAMAHQCLAKLKLLSHDQKIKFDLSKTETIHSSFIGFLIYANQVTEKEGGELSLDISPSLKKIFTMLNIENYFLLVSISG